MPKFLGKRREPIVAIAKGTDPYGTTKKAIDLLGGIRKFVDPGDVVWVKPNWNSTTVNEDALLAGGTDPRVTAALVKICLDEGKAKKVIVSELSGAGSTSAGCYSWKLWGKPLGDYSKEAGAELVEMDTSQYKEFEIPKGKILKRALLPTLVDEANVYINNPKVKTHLVGVMTLGIKNNQGLFNSEDKMEYHRTDIGQKLVDLLNVAYPDLTVIEGLTAGERQSPHNPSLRKGTNVITAGSDIVALDAVTSKIFGVEPEEVPMTRLAAEAGFGEMDLNKIRVVGNKIEEVYCPLKRAVRGFWGFYTPFAEVIVGGVCDGCIAWTQSALDCWVVYPEYKDILDAIKAKGIKATLICGYDARVSHEDLHEWIKRGPVFAVGDCCPAWIRGHEGVTYLYGCPPWEAFWLPGGFVDGWKKWGIEARPF